MKFFLRSLFLATVVITSIEAIVVFKGNSVADTTKTFLTAFNSCVFHTPTQNLFLGLDNTSSTYSLTKLSTTQGSCIGITSTTGNNPLANTFVNHLALSTPLTTPEQPRIICTSAADGVTAPTAVFAVNINGSIVTTSGDLNDSTGTTTTGSIVNLAASDSYIFAAVITNGGNITSFGTGANDGIALLKIDQSSQALTKLNATTGFNGNTALTLTTTTPQIVAGGGALTFAANYNPAFCWNQTLQRLYIGLQGAANNSMVSVAIAEANEATNILSFLNPVGGNYAPIDNNTRIIGTAGGANNITAKQLAVMETSTGFFYLIVQGGNNTATNTNNLVYAVPLVSGIGVADNILGTFAKADLTSNDFTIQATQAGDLFANTNTAALVGSGSYPGGATKIATAPVTHDATQGISSLFVHGDTVYISIQANNGPAGNTIPGIYYSQALFNDKGKIQSWTDWSKAAPFESGVSTVDGSTNNVFVNAITGHIITTDISRTIINTTEWLIEDPNNNNALLNILNSTFPDGCFSSYNLNQSTKKLGDVTNNNYAFFGGRGTIAFAFLGTSSTLTTDFSLLTNFLTTPLPNDTDPVTCLGFSKWTEAQNRGFFFAGTKNGLYAYANTATGAGFNQEQLGTLNFAPFGACSWQKITSVTGEVRAIKSIGGSLYVLTKSIDTNGSPLDKVFQISTSASINDIVLNTQTIATSNTTAGGANLIGVYLFFDIALMPSSENLATSYALLATSNGIYRSAANIDAQNNQTNAAWTQATTDVTDRIFTLNNTFYPFTCYTTSWTNSTTQAKSYNKALIHQFSTISNNTTLTETPSNSYVSSTETPSLINSISTFFNDGTRRFMVMQPDTGNGYNNNLYTLPYMNNSTTWNYANSPYGLLDEFLSPDTVERYYWIQLIGVTGNLYVGTNNGVIALG